MQAHAWGIKTFYYSLINKAGSKSVDKVIETLAQDTTEQQEEDCESCKL